MRLRRQKLANLVPWTANGKGDKRELLASRDRVIGDGDNRKFLSVFVYLFLIVLCTLLDSVLVLTLFYLKTYPLIKVLLRNSVRETL